MHEGTDNIESQKAKDILDYFVFIADGSHKQRFIECYFGDPKYDGKNFLQLSANQFCKDMIEAVNKWLLDSKNNLLVQNNMQKMLVIREHGFSIGGMRID